ncbi:hypothetical protein MUK42_04609 [Musa troglodytarum]|uniref:Uncharacterized protein n=1 Tax=Musa troglodytarum TaxID=320322 RepID=A0A9E7FRG4_9LILI|nr:hypothetical protein MUK42_04609 [Musa troglodytarum]
MNQSGWWYYMPNTRIELDVQLKCKESEQYAKENGEQATEGGGVAVLCFPWEGGRPCGGVLEQRNFRVADGLTNTRKIELKQIHLIHISSAFSLNRNVKELNDVLKDSINAEGKLPQAATAQDSPRRHGMTSLATVFHIDIKSDSGGKRTRGHPNAEGFYPALPRQVDDRTLSVSGGSRRDPELRRQLGRLAVPSPEGPAPPHLESPLNVGAVVAGVQEPVEPGEQDLLLRRQWQREDGVGEAVLDEVAVEALAGPPHPPEVLVEGLQPGPQQQAPRLLGHQNMALAHPDEQPGRHPAHFVPVDGWHP